MDRKCTHVYLIRIQLANGKCRWDYGVPVKCSWKRPALRPLPVAETPMAARGSEVMEIKTCFQARKSQNWRYCTQVLFTTALMPHVTSMSTSSALQRKVTLRQDHTFPSTGTKIPLDSTRTADTAM